MMSSHHCSLASGDDSNSREGTKNSIPLLLPDNDCLRSQSWCHLCEGTIEGPCVKHGDVTIIPDKPILSRAEASLPCGLSVMKDSDTDQVNGIVTKRHFPMNSLFGPIMASLVSNTDINTEYHPIYTQSNDKNIYLFKFGDMDHCNWTMFIKPAKTAAEQNLAVAEIDGSVYLVSNRSIHYREELKYGYSVGYAKKYGLENLLLAEDIKELTCKTCNASFSTNIAKLRHSMNSKCGRKNKAKKQSHNDNAKRTAKKESSADNDVVQQAPPSGGTARTIRRVQCPSCHLAFGQVELMKIHQLSHNIEHENSSEIHTEDRNSTVNELDDDNRAATDEISRDTYMSTDVEGKLSHRCPACLEGFHELDSLIAHVTNEHSKRASKPSTNLDSFETIPDEHDTKATQDEKKATSTLGYVIEENHDVVVDKYKYSCPQCDKKLSTYGALSCHLRAHNLKTAKKFYGCFLCNEKFNSSREVTKHVESHAVNGYFYCPHCPNKKFERWLQCRKHFQAIHSGREFPCDKCDKVFSRPDKLRLHLLTHTNIKEHMCDTCGRQFARKDKLLDHIRRVHPEHGPEDDAKSGAPARTRKFQPKVPPSNFERFIYKCLDCSLGFKRRGMLVNHLAKVHPTTPLNSIPELNLPILRTQKEFHCPHCSRVYKSTGKRKVHIMKCHPNSEIPPSAKSKDYSKVADNYSSTVGSIPTYPYSCEYCHRQYANKAKLVAHKRAKHPESFVNEHDIHDTTRHDIQKEMSDRSRLEEQMPAVISSHDVDIIMPHLGDNQHDSMTISLPTINISGAEGTVRVDGTDLLTHAMSVNELHSSFDFQSQHQLMSSNSSQSGLPQGSIELRLLPALDITSLQMPNFPTTGLALGVATSSMSMSPNQSMHQRLVSAVTTSSIESHISSSDSRPTW